VNSGKVSLIEYSGNYKEVRPVHFDDQDGDYSIMTAQLFFQRRVLFYNFNFVIPSVLITILIVAGFALPCESGEKSAYVISKETYVQRVLIYTAVLIHQFDKIISF